MTISDAMKAAVFSQETEEVFLVLLTLNHIELDEPIRLVNNTEQIVSNGNTFIPFPFRLTLPIDDSTSLPRASLEVDNVDRQIVEAIRTITSAPTVTLEIVRAAAPDVIEISWDDFRLQDVSYNSLTITGTLSMENFIGEPYPSDQFVPSTFPGIF